MELAFERKARTHASSCSKIKKKVNKKKKTVICTVESCSISFSSKKLLKKHFKQSHPTLAPLFSCSICAKTFNDASNYRRHIKTHRDQMDVSCPFCQTKCYKYHLPRHIKRYHGPIRIVEEVIKDLIIDVCLKVSRRSSSFSPNVLAMAPSLLNRSLRTLPTFISDHNTPSISLGQTSLDIDLGRISPDTSFAHATHKTHSEKTNPTSFEQNHPDILSVGQTSLIIGNIRHRQDVFQEDEEGIHLVPLQSIATGAQFVCAICAYTTCTRRNLDKHHESLHSDKTVTCARSFCDQDFPTKFMMLAHLTNCFLHCEWDGCDKQFRYLKKYEAHIRGHRNILRRMM